MFEKLFQKSIMQFLYAIGYFGEEITVVYAIVALFFLSKSYLFIYLLAYAIFKITIEQLKEITHDPRPNAPVKFLNTNRFDSGRPGELVGRSFGMPSGHASGVAFSLTFVYLMTYKYLWQSILLLGITINERYTFRNHTLYQLIVGAILGVTVASATVYLVKTFVKK